MLAIMGDLHGSWGALHFLDKEVEGQSDFRGVIQVGDFGFYPERLEHWVAPSFPVFALEGNHEHFPMLRELPKDSISKIAENLYYVPRGFVLELDGWKFGCCGGGESVDKAYRKEGVNWFPEERVQFSDIEKLFDKEIDMLITHTPPISLIRKAFSRLKHEDWGLPKDWVDVSSTRIETLWFAKGQIPLYCGHMHRNIHGPEQYGMNIRIIDIDSWVFLPTKPM